jgi:PTH1 family peptidyl-tRNA hydrolase
MAVEALAREGSGIWSSDLLSRTCRMDIGNYPVLLVQPLTFMNRSGEVVHVLLSALHRASQDLLLLVDDLNLPFGRIRIRERGSAGGHRGLESILTALETDEIVRVRMGIGEDQIPENKSEFVLADFQPEKQKDLDEMIINAGNAVKSILSDGVSKTMAIFNASLP